MIQQIQLIAKHTFFLKSMSLFFLQWYWCINCLITRYFKDQLWVSRVGGAISWSWMIHVLAITNCTCFLTCCAFRRSSPRHSFLFFYVYRSIDSFPHAREMFHGLRIRDDFVCSRPSRCARMFHFLSLFLFVEENPWIRSKLKLTTGREKRDD